MLAIVGLLTALAGCIGGPERGAAAPAIIATDTAGEPVSIRAGEVTGLYFFATWCPTCRVATPNVVALSERYAGDPRVRIVGVHFDDNHRRATPAEYAAEHGMGFQVIADGTRVVAEYGIRQLPAFLLVGTDGTVIHKQWDVTPGDVDRLRRRIDRELSDG